MLYHPCHLRVGAALGPQDIRDTVQHNSCTRNTIAQVVRTICDILAKNVEIVRKAYRGGRADAPQACRQPTASPGTGTNPHTVELDRRG
jgi:hypothetical protein